MACRPLEVKANSTMCSEKNASASSPASLDLGRQVQFGRDKAQKKPADEEIKGDQSTEDKQDDEVGSAMTEEFNSSFMGVSENRRQPKHDAVPFKDWVWARSMGQNPQGLERMESGLSVVTSYGGESNGCEDLTRYSMSMDQARRTIMTAARSAARSAAMNNAEEPSGTERSDLRDDVGQKLKAAMDGNASASSSSSAATAVMACLPGEHLFDKAVTPSDVGKLNRLVIPKQHAEKYFPLDINSIEKGLLLNFEDNRGKIWTFRYSYWNSSQSYVLTKGWTRFVKDKKLEAGDIVSFQRGSTDQRHQLYISWRRGPSGLSRFRFGPQPHQSKAGLVYPVKGSSSLNPLNSGTQATVLYNSQWMPIFWPSSSNPNAFTQLSAHTVSPLVNKVVQWDAVWSQSPVTPLHGTLPFSLSAPPHKETVQSRLYDINSCGLQPTDQYLSLHNSFNSSEGGTNIEALHPFVNPAPRSAAQELENPEHKPASSVDLTTKKGVRLFGVTLAEPRR